MISTDTLLFPNASYVMSKAEFEFWMAEDVAAAIAGGSPQLCPGRATQPHQC